MMCSLTSFPGDSTAGWDAARIKLGIGGRVGFREFSNKFGVVLWILGFYTMQEIELDKTAANRNHKRVTWLTGWAYSQRCSPNHITFQGFRSLQNGRRYMSVANVPIAVSN